MKIKSIFPLQILDSRGWPTIRVILTTTKGNVVSASVPSGASTGIHEALELRDQDEKHYFGKGVQKAIENIKTKITPKLLGLEFSHPQEIDAILTSLDGSENKSNLGANAILAVSLVGMRAFAADENLSLWQAINRFYFSDFVPNFPRLMVNLINGGQHANWAFDFQEYLIIPKANTPSIALEISSTIFHALEKELKKNGLNINKGDEGGFSPSLESNQSPLELISSVARSVNYNSGKDYTFGLDSAASEFFEDNKYHLKRNQVQYSANELAKYYLELQNQYQIESFEDPFAQDDWNSWTEFNGSSAPKSLVVVGDDLLVTNTKRISLALEKNACNAILIKVNQIGTLSETVQAIKLAKSNGWKIAISHRSGETEDTFIADLSYACGADYLKSGSVSRSERLAKYNRLLEIEKMESD